MSALQLDFFFGVAPACDMGRKPRRPCRTNRRGRLNRAARLIRRAPPKPGAALGEDFGHDKACSGDTKARIVPIEFQTFFLGDAQ